MLTFQAEIMPDKLCDWLDGSGMEEEAWRSDIGRASNLLFDKTYILRVVRQSLAAHGILMVLCSVATSSFRANLCSCEMAT